MGKSMPDQPDYAAATKDAVYADLNSLPLRRLIEAAAKTGGKVTSGGTTYDYTGLGDADVQSQYADQMAGVLLDLQQTYGADYVKQRLAELQASDPEGQTARKQLYASIQKQAADIGAQAGAKELEQSQLADLQQGGTLDAAMTREVQQGVRGGQVARGNVLGNAAAAQEAGAVAGTAEALKAQRQENALKYLASGVSPDEVEWKKTQQVMSDLGSYINGVTPAAQFSSVSSAGNGAVPFTTSTPTTGVNANAGAQGASNALQVYQGNINWQSQQANPYTAGLGIGARTYGLVTAAQAGGKPAGGSTFYDQRGNVSGG